MKYHLCTAADSAEKLSTGILQETPLPDSIVVQVGLGLKKLFYSLGSSYVVQLLRILIRSPDTRLCVAKFDFYNVIIKKGLEINE